MQPISFNTFSMQRPNPGIDPNSYAQNYATQNGLSLEDAKTQLQAKFGAPEQPSSIFKSNENNFQATTLDNFDFSELEGIDLGDQDFSLKNLFHGFIDFFKGESMNASNVGPQKEGDPQPHLSGIDSSSNVQGPQKEGDPQFHLQGAQNSDGPQQEGDPQPHLKQGMNSSNIQGPQKEGDPQPHLQQGFDMGEIGGSHRPGFNPFEKMGTDAFSDDFEDEKQGAQAGLDPNAYLEKYAQENNLTLSEAKKELQALFGDPERR